MPEQDPVCPECGGPIGQTSTYCMHCSADLTEYRERTTQGEASTGAGVDSDEGMVDLDGAEDIERRGVEDEPEADYYDLPAEMRATSSGMEGGRLYPEGFMSGVVSVAFALVAGVVIGVLAIMLTAVLIPGSSPVLIGAGAWAIGTYGLLEWQPV